MKKTFKNLLSFFLIILMLYSFYNIYIKLKDYKKADETYSNLEELYENNISSDNTSSNSNDLLSINKEFKFWIKVDNTNINYPVVQGTDNSFYLNKDFYKNNSSSGTIFIDYKNNYNEDKNVVLYGHNMKNKTMFANLEKYKDRNFFNQNNKIRILDNGKEYVYEVFSVYYTSASDSNIMISFSNDSEFMEYIDYIRGKSLFDCNLSVDKDDRIITLATCSYEEKDNRTIVHGKLLTD